MGFKTLFRSKNLLDKEVEDRYEIGKKLGTGNFAVVFSAKDKKSGKDYAVKIISRKRIKDKEHLVEGELAVLRKLNHPNIIPLVEVVESKKNINVVTGMASGGDLFAYVTSKGKLAEPEAKEFARQILKALEYIHSFQIVHRDIKPENILLSNPTDKQILIIDFGLAVPIKDGRLLREACGSPEYVAPEVLRPQHHGYDMKADLWSVGVVTYIMLGGYHPFSAASEEDRNALIRNANYEFHPERWSAVSNVAKDFIKRLIEVDYAERMDAKTALEHPWLAVSDEQAKKEKAEVEEAQARLEQERKEHERKESERKKSEIEELKQKEKAKEKEPETPSKEVASPAKEGGTPKEEKPQEPLSPDDEPDILDELLSPDAPDILDELDAWKELDELGQNAEQIKAEEEKKLQEERSRRDWEIKIEQERIAKEDLAKKKELEEEERKAKEADDKKKKELEALHHDAIDQAFGELESTMKGL